MSYKLSLAEQVLLFQLDERSGHITGTYTPLMLLAAELAELALENRVAINDKKTSLLNDTPTDDSGRNELLARLQKYPRELATYHIDNTHLKEGIASRLVNRTIWASEEERTFFSRRMIYATIDPEPAEQLKFSLQKTLESHQPVDPQQAILIGILKGARRLDTFLTRQEQRFFDDRIRQIIADSSIASALSRQIATVIETDEAAALTAAIAVISS